MKLVNAEDLSAMINRSLLIVRVNEPFIEWANCSTLESERCTRSD